jgi:DNA polymerase-3 subunit alpha
LLDGASRIPELIERTKTLGMNSLAITDHGNLYGALEFYMQARDAGINPILGYEAYVAPGHRTNREATRQKEASFHLTLLAKNRRGFQNLIKMASAAYLEGFYYKPRIDRELLEQHHEGLICLSGCAAGELSNLLLGERWDEAEQLVAWYLSLFGNDYYLEIQNAGFKIQQDCAERTIELADRMGLPLVATNDAHYLRQEDSSAHDVLLCVNTKSLRTDTNRMKMEGDQLFVRSPEQMYEAFPGQADAVARSQEIADQVGIDLDLKSRHFPVFQPPPGKSDADHLRDLCEQGLRERYGDKITPEVRERLEYELGIVIRMGFASYFLIVWDFARFARENGIPCLARGSACGALVSYVLGLSNVCPLKYDLLFERFLDPNRAEAPDIDMDFCRDHRAMVLNYVREKYGADNVAQIGTFGTLGAKAVIRDVARALGVPLSRADEVAKFVPTGPDVSLKSALEESPDLRSAYDSDPAIREVIDFGQQLEGLAKSAGTHAAGVVISDQPLTEYVPLQRLSGKDEVLTQWTDVEKAGLLKMDFLGLRNLTILGKAVQNVKKHRAIDIDPGNLPLDDKTTFALLQRGETKGIFQLESGGMRDLLTKMKPDAFNDIIATSALYRPGPLEGGMVMRYVNVKNGQEKPETVHPVVDEILAETYGVMVYQEQVMRILNRLGGIELSKAYACIKAISKKKAELIEKNRSEFVKGAVTRGMAEAVAKGIFDKIEKFGGYGFNKSHSTAYAAIAYQTAYLKAHFPVEFMAALLSCEMESTADISEHVDDCRRMRIDVLPPDVNTSDVEFDAVASKISFGLGAIKGLGEQVGIAIVAERKANGPFKDIFDLTERIDPRCMQKGMLEILIKAGTLDSFGPNRAQHLAVVERAVAHASARQRDKQAGQKTLFGGDETPAAGASTDGANLASLPDLPDIPHSQKLAMEKEVIGFYLTSHPLTQYADKLELYASHSTADLHALPDKADVRVGGMISAIKRTQTKKPGRNGHTRYANFDFEDTRGVIRCIMWPEEFSKFGELVQNETMCFLQGKVDRRGREPNLIVEELITLDQAEKKFTDQVAIKFQRGLHTNDEVQRAREILKRYPGRCDVVLVVESFDDANPSQRVKYLLTPAAETPVAADSRLATELRAVLGPGNVKFLTTQRKKPNGPHVRTGNGVGANAYAR